MDPDFDPNEEDREEIFEARKKARMAMIRSNSPLAAQCLALEGLAAEMGLFLGLECDPDGTDLDVWP